MKQRSTDRSTTWAVLAGLALSPIVTAQEPKHPDGYVRWSSGYIEEVAYDLEAGFGDRSI